MRNHHAHAIALVRVQMLLTLTALLLVTTSCRRESGKPPAPPTAPKVATSPADKKVAAAKPTPPIAPPDATTTEKSENTTTEKMENGEPSRNEPSAAVSAGPAAPPAPTTGHERILVLMPESPLLIDLALSIDGQPHTAALDTLVAEVLKVADTNEDGRPMWSELTASPRFKYGQYGNLAIDGDNGPKQITERYDIDHDGMVDDTEFPRFLTRNAGGSRAFSIRGTMYDSLSSQRDAPTWRVLDFDDNGNLSPEEIASAAARLRLRDANDDEILVSTELRASTAAATMDAMPRRRGGRDAAELLGPHARWDAVRSNLEEVYALGGALKPADFPLTPQLFAQLDEDGDGRLKRKEFERLDNAVGQVELAVTFGRGSAKSESGSEAADESEADNNQAVTAPRATVRIVSVSGEITAPHAITQLADDRVLLRIGDFPLLIYVNDLVAGGDFEQQAEQALASFDGDKNGYLEASELPAEAQSRLGRFEAVDVDGDGKVYVGEIITFLGQQQRALRSQIHARVTGRDDSLGLALDRNDDGRIDSREIETAPARLAELDRNADGTLDLDELPTGMILAIGRGSLEAPEALFAMPNRTTATPTGDAPRWFQQMDANRDGSISLREFIGPPEVFQRLDENTDGFLDPAEATKIEPQGEQSGERGT